MVRSYQLEEGRIKDCDNSVASILIYFNPDEVEKRYLTQELCIDEHTLNSALDPDELSRLEFEPEHIAVIFKRPKKYSAEDNFLFRIMSMGLFLFPEKEKLVIVAVEEFPLFDDRRAIRFRSLRDVFLRIINRSVAHFTDHLKVINKISDELETQIRKSMENKYLHYMFALEKSLVYYLNAANANTNLLQKLKNYDAKLSFDPEEKEFLDDLIIENAQCFRQAEIYSSILGGMMDARASIVSNNLNIMMKRLAVITIVVGAMNIPASMLGMSEYSRFVIDGLQVHWITANVFFVAALIVTGILSYKALAFFRFFSTDEPDRRTHWFKRLFFWSHKD